MGAVLGEAGGRRPDREKASDSASVWRMKELTRDGTAGPVSHHYFLRHDAKNIFLVQLTMSTICNHNRLIRTRGRKVENTTRKENVQGAFHTKRNENGTKYWGKATVFG